MSESISESEEEVPSESDLIKLLREKGEDPETKRQFQIWLQREERVAEANPDTLAQIELSLRLGRLLLSAGQGDESYDCFKAARTQAFQEGRTELYQAISNEIDTIENS